MPRQRTDTGPVMASMQTSWSRLPDGAFPQITALASCLCFSKSLHRAQWLVQHRKLLRRLNRNSEQEFPGQYFMTEPGLITFRLAVVPSWICNPMLRNSIFKMAAIFVVVVIDEIGDPITVYLCVPLWSNWILSYLFLHFWQQNQVSLLRQYPWHNTCIDLKLKLFSLLL